MADLGETKVEVVGVFERPTAGEGEEVGSPLLVLRDAADREVHISIGSCEALAVHLALARHVVARPLTHDLAIRLLERLAATVEKVVIRRRAWNGYQAAIYLQAQEGPIALPAEPGDAVAIALRAEAPIFATEEALLGVEPGQEGW